MKISEIKIEDLLNYCRIDDPDSSDMSLLQKLHQVACKFICDYTGLSKEECDIHEDFVIVVYILCQDMYDNRVLNVDKNNLNTVVKTILGMHCRNLL